MEENYSHAVDLLDSSHHEKSRKHNFKNKRNSLKGIYQMKRGGLDIIAQKSIESSKGGNSHLPI